MFFICGLSLIMVLLFVPVVNVPIPRCVRQNPLLRKFFAWDCAEQFRTEFDETALRAYLQHKNHRER